MTPSGWHDDARNRDAGHDEMQIAVFDYRRALSMEDMLGRPDTPIEGYSYRRKGIFFEYPLIRDEQILAWGDIVEVWEKKISKEPTQIIHKIYEIKPKITALERSFVNATPCGGRERGAAIMIVAVDGETN